jgi:hypothetical protein
VILGWFGVAGHRRCRSTGEADKLAQVVPGLDIDKVAAGPTDSGGKGAIPESGREPGAADVTMNVKPHLREDGR